MIIVGLRIDVDTFRGTRDGVSNLCRLLSGEGIAASALPHLFEPFYRTDASRSRKTGGFGLGLSLCKAVIEAHHGRIEITSRLGQGTRATVLLPVDKS